MDVYAARRRAELRGRVRVFWLTHGARVREVGLWAALVVLTGLSHRWAYQDELEAERAQARELAERVEWLEDKRREEALAAGLPGTVYIVNGRTPREAAERLMDAVRALDRQPSPGLAQAGTP